MDDQRPPHRRFLVLGVIAAVLAGTTTATVLLRRTLDDCRRAEAAAATSLAWWFAERPEPGRFVRPQGALACAPTRVTAIRPVRSVERRVGGPVAVSVELRIDEDAPALALTRAAEIHAGIHKAALPGLPDALRDRASRGDVDTSELWRLPIGTSLHMMLCRMEGGFLVTYAPRRSDADVRAPSPRT